MKPPRLMLFVFITLLPALQAFALPRAFKGAVGFGMGGNLTPLISDSSTQAYGVGVGNQYSFYAVGFRERTWALKLRADAIRAREQSVTSADTRSIAPQTIFSRAEQNWTIFSANVEKQFTVRAQTLFWEAGLGYAYGRGGTIALSSTVLDTPAQEFPVSQSNAFAVIGGIGFRKDIMKRLTAVIDARTFFLLGTVYNQGPFNKMTFLPIPLMVGLSVEYSFDIPK